MTAADELVVLTIDLYDTHCAVAVTFTANWIVEPLPVRGFAAATRSASVSVNEVIADALTHGSMAVARRTGVLAPPDQVVITYPADWSQVRADAVRDAADEAAFAHNRTVLRARPTLGDQ